MPTDPVGDPQVGFPQRNMGALSAKALNIMNRDLTPLMPFDILSASLPSLPSH